MSDQRKPATDRRTAVTRAEFDAHVKELHEMKEMVKDLHSALLVPQPGHEKSLLNRMATVTIAIESGDNAGKVIVRVAQIIVAIGTVVSAVWIWRNTGQGPK